jgi:hypothetical protein
MAGSLSLKTAFIIFLLYGIDLIMCACMNPVDVPAYLEEDSNQEIIESTKVKVKIDEGSDDFTALTGENGRISGLKPGKYYLIEKEKDTDGDFADDYPKYVSDLPGPGRLVDSLGGITTISGGMINRLTNLHTYTVRTAKPFPDSTVFDYTDKGGTKPVTVTNGAIAIYPQGNLTLDLTSKLTSGTPFEIIAVAVGSSKVENWIDFSGDERQSIFDSNWDSLPLEDIGTIVDYVIIELDSSGDPVIPVNFQVLRVEVKPCEISFIVTFDDQEHANISGGSLAISRSTIEAGGIVTFTLDAPAGGGSWKSYYWEIAGMDLSGYDDVDLVINSTFCEVLFTGKVLEVTVVADDGIKLWSDTIKIYINL